VPFLRVVRDKRGYETTYLMHWYREGTRQRTRILYVFRTPGGVRVGREPLEPDVLRDIESLFPAIAFDWKAVLAKPMSGGDDKEIALAPGLEYALAFTVWSGADRDIGSRKSLTQLGKLLAQAVCE